MIRSLILLLPVLFPLLSIGQADYWEEKLGKAAQHHRVEEVKEILDLFKTGEIKMDLDGESGYFESSPLFKAVDNAYGPHDSLAVKTIQLLLDEGADIRYKDKYNTTLLHLATEARMPWLMTRCLEKGVDPNGISQTHGSPLMASMIYADSVVIQILIDAGADLTWANEYQNSILHEAARHGEDWLIRACLGAGGSPLLKDSHDRTPLDLYIVASGKNPLMLDPLGWENADKGKALIRALERDKIFVINRLFREGKLFNQPGLPLLIHAAIVSEPETAAHLMELGADIEETDSLGWTALHHATMSNRLEMVELLLKCGADPNIMDPMGRTPMHLFPYVLEADLEHRSRMRSWTPPPESPVPVRKALKAAGGRTDVRDKNGETPADYARRHLAAAGDFPLWYAAELEAFFEE